MTDHQDGWWSFTVTVPSDLCGSYYIMPAETVPDEIVEGLSAEDSSDEEPACADSPSTTAVKASPHHDPHQHIDFRARWKALMKLMVVDPCAHVPPLRSLRSSRSTPGTNHSYYAKSSGIVRLNDALPEPGWNTVNVSAAPIDNTAARFTPPLHMAPVVRIFPGQTRVGENSWRQ